MDQRIGVDALQGRRGVGGVGLRREGRGGSEAEDRSQALAAGFERVAHRGMEAGRAGRGGRRQTTERSFRLLDECLVP